VSRGIDPPVELGERPAFLLEDQRQAIWCELGALS
jgi:hypothetical protein